ncbi:MAG: outer membrane lipoprotein carrier protein LolA [Alphaproteobacteria bacterium]|nr:outer membrane lipoprotein carrier protein LolA [Alphaproteobacteria bacterium]
MSSRPPARGPSRRLVLAGLAAALALPRAARAALKPADQFALQRVQTYLNGIHTMVSKFDQVAGNGATATGMIYLQRPGHMRIVYNPPHPILIVATNGEVYYYDAALGQSTWVNLDETPAWFLLQNFVELGGDIQPEDVQHTPGALRVTVSEAKHPDRGRVTMVFSEQPMELRQWTVVDAQNKTVTVTLDSPQFGVPVNPQLFIWQPPGAAPSGG